MPSEPHKLTAAEMKDRDAETLRLLLNLKAVFKKYISKRDRYRCCMTGEIRNVGISHMLGAAGSPNEAIAYNEMNVHVMSNRLHRQYHESNPLPYIRFMLEKYGQEELDKLEKLSMINHRLTKQEIIDTTNHYVKLTKALGEVDRLKEYKAGKK